MYRVGLYIIGWFLQYLPGLACCKIPQMKMKVFLICHFCTIGRYIAVILFKWGFLGLSGDICSQLICTLYFQLLDRAFDYDRTIVPDCSFA